MDLGKPSRVCFDFLSRNLSVLGSFFVVAMTFSRIPCLGFNNLNFHLFHFFKLEDHNYQVYRRGGTVPSRLYTITSTRPSILTTQNPPTSKSVDVVDSVEPTIRKSFPESWIFDSFEDSLGYFQFFLDT